MTKGKEFLPLSPEQRDSSARTIQLIPQALMKGTSCLWQSPCRGSGTAAPFGNPLDGSARGENHPFPSALQTDASPLTVWAVKHTLRIHSRQLCQHLKYQKLNCQSQSCVKLVRLYPVNALFSLYLQKFCQYWGAWKEWLFPVTPVKTEGTCWNKCLSLRKMKEKHMRFSLTEHTGNPDQ